VSGNGVAAMNGAFDPPFGDCSQDIPIGTLAKGGAERSRR
jgi:hypothetical protein